MRLSRVVFLLFVSIALLIDSHARADEHNPFDVHDTVLPNGLHVITDHASRVPVISVVLGFRVGLGEEPPNRKGLANLTLALMTHRTKHLRDGEILHQLDTVASSWRWGADSDRAALVVTIQPRALERILWLLSDMTGFFVESLDQAEVDELVALESTTQAQVNDIKGGLVGQLAQHALFPDGHPYHRLADDSQLRGVTAGEIAAFHKRWFVPRNAYLSVTGLVDPEATLALASKYFGTIPGGNPPQHRVAEPSRLAGETRIEVGAPTSAMTVGIEWPTPREFAAGDGELDGVAKILDGTRIAQLAWELHSNKHLVSDVSAGQHSSRDASVFDITATVLPGHTASEVVDAIDVVLRDLTTSKLSDDDVRGAIVPYLLDYAFGFEQSFTRGFRYVEWALITDAPASEFFFEQFKRYEIDGKAIVDAAAHHLPLDRRVISVVVPDSNAPLHGILRSNTFKPAGTP